MPSAPAKKILLVDDSRTSLLLLQRMLKRSSYELLTAADGEEAIAKALSLHPDLIVMDVMMPRMSGFEALRRLREEPSTQATPVILVTTLGDAASMEEGYETGCTEYVTKPVESVELLAKVEAYIGR